MQVLRGQAMTHEVREPSGKYWTAGYRATEIGRFPFDWQVMQLGQIATIERGKFSARPRNDPKYYGGEFPFIQTGDVTRSGGLITTFTQTLNTEGLQVSRLFPKGTLFFTIAANIGDVGIASFESACPDSLVAIVPTGAIEKEWLLYELARRKRDFESLASPGAQLNINLEKLRPYLVPVPTAREQRAIATALADVDALITGLNRLIAKKRDLKQAAMQQLLTGQTRLPGFQGEWEVKRFGDLGVFLKGSGVKKDESQSGDLACVRYGEIYTRHNDLVRTFNSWISSDVARIATRLKLGDLLFAGSGETKAEIGKCVAFLDDCEAYAGGDIVILRPTGVNSLFMGYYCNTVAINAQKAGKGQGYSVVHISAAALASLWVTLPGLAEQTAIATILSDMDAELTALEARRDKTRALKLGMMQELLTGRTRLV